MPTWDEVREDLNIQLGAFFMMETGAWDEKRQEQSESKVVGDEIPNNIIPFSKR